MKNKLEHRHKTENLIDIVSIFFSIIIPTRLRKDLDGICVDFVF